MTGATRDDEPTMTTPTTRVTIHMVASLDGFIATPSGDSQFVTGSDNLVHAHRLRALYDAVVVGAGTVAADNPQLTTRLVSGPNPLRVVFDPERRLQPTYRVFTDAAAPTLYVCDQTRVAAGEERGRQADGGTGTGADSGTFQCGSVAVAADHRS